MTVDELEFKAAGCCGEYQVAKAERPDGTLQITRAGEHFRVVRISGGMMVEDLGVIDSTAVNRLLEA